jgi:hypothetical protein
MWASMWFQDQMNNVFGTFMEGNKIGILGAVLPPKLCFIITHCDIFSTLRHLYYAFLNWLIWTYSILGVGCWVFKIKFVPIWFWLSNFPQCKGTRLWYSRKIWALNLYCNNCWNFAAKFDSMYGDIGEIQWKFQEMAASVTKGVPSWVWAA